MTVMYGNTIKVILLQLEIINEEEVIMINGRSVDYYVCTMDSFKNNNYYVLKIIIL